MLNWEIFRENFIFANCAKRHICNVSNSRLGHELPTSINDRLISTFREDFIFAKICEVLQNQNPREISEFTVLDSAYEILVLISYTSSEDSENTEKPHQNP